MVDGFETLIGSIAAILTTSCFLPQAWKVIRTKDTKSLSLSMYTMFTAGVVSWLFYGILIESLPIIIANSFTLILSSIILVYKIKEKNYS